MGIFRDIVRKSKVKEKSFGLGLTIEGEKENIEFDVRFKEEADSVEPAIDSATVRFGDDEVVFEAATGMEFGIQYGSYNEERKQHRVSISPGLLEDPLSLVPFPYSLFQSERTCRLERNYWRSFCARIAT